MVLLGLINTIHLLILHYFLNTLVNGLVANLLDSLVVILLLNILGFLFFPPILNYVLHIDHHLVLIKNVLHSCQTNPDLLNYHILTVAFDFEYLFNYTVLTTNTDLFVVVMTNQNCKNEEKVFHFLKEVELVQFREHRLKQFNVQHVQLISCLKYLNKPNLILQSIRKTNMLA